VATQLLITAATGAQTYKVGESPVVSIVVTNRGPTPCVANLSDRLIDLQVSSGAARVWGSHDCATAPDTAAVTLPVQQATRRDVQWSGLSSQVGCAGTRARVPAGAYTLSAALSGQAGTSVAFTLTE
jgi:hypothetical protein